jgi:hypothetical protein
MVPIASLWIPILLSAVVVFVASFVLHMLIPFHRSDYQKLPNEDRVVDALRGFGIPPGDYMAPSASGPAAMRDPAFLEKMNKGPVVVATFMPVGPIRMGAQLTQWFVYCVVVSLLAALATSITYRAGANHHSVVHFSALIAFIGYTVAMWQLSIWYHRSWATTLRYTVDGAIYGFLTGLMFGWFWPH